MDSSTESFDCVGFSEFSTDEKLWRAIVAEFTGTLLLVLIGCASCLGGWATHDSHTVIEIAFTFGLIIATMIQCFGHLSGGHFNPAVSLGLLIAHQISLSRAFLYVIVQAIGAIAGAAILAEITPEERQGQLGATMVDYSINVFEACTIEFMITLVLVLTVLAVCDKNRTDVKGSEPLAIGLAVTACHIAAVPLTGSSMNPARSLGPAIIAGIWQHHWVYWVGPFSGAVVGGLLYKYIFRAQPRQYLSAFQQII